MDVRNQTATDVLNKAAVVTNRRTRVPHHEVNAIYLTL